jgi:hypothetical protein
MKLAIRLGLTLAALSLVSGASAQDSLRASGYASGASMAAVSIVPASVVVVSVHVGSVMIVESIRVVGDVVEVIFKGAAHASRAVVTVTAASVKATSLAVGQSVKVVAEGSGYLLVSAGKVLCFVPGEDDQKLIRSARSN